MYSKLKHLYRLLDTRQQVRLLKLQLLVVLMALAEMVSVFSIGPFMALVADSDRIAAGGFLTDLYRLSGATSAEEFLFFLGGGVLGALGIAATITIYTIWRLTYYGQRLGAELSSRLYRYYMRQPWLYHVNGNSAQLVNKIGVECNRLTEYVITQVLHLNARIVLATVLALAILFYNPFVAITGILLFACVYFTLYRIVQLRLATNGVTVTRTSRERMKLMQEGFGGIKDTLLLGRQADFNQRYDKASRTYGLAQANNAIMVLTPRYAIELIAFGAIISLMLYLLVSRNGDLGEILPLLAVYALAGFKLLPAFQQIYAAITTLRGNLAAFDNLQQDLEASRDVGTFISANASPHKKAVKNQISLNNIRFRYPGKSEWALDGVSVVVPVNQVIGIVGASGAGKSTVVDILLGLITPDEGELRIDGVPLSEQDRCAWQNSIGYVSQSIFLADASIRENIAFGLPEAEIDEELVRRAASMARLDELLACLPQGLSTTVGERGVQVAGGERQRIGIARALYEDADVLVFDEATSALDGITEKLVMDAIHDFSGKKTIIMIAHRLSTVRECDRIYVMENGRFADSGTFDELASRNGFFKEVADHT